MLHDDIVDGDWSAWQSWNECSQSCGGGVTSRYRVCDNPTPDFGGDDCVGAAMETERCNAEKCTEGKQLYSLT